jgi:Ca2+-binding RTX toxin-like protein
MSRARQSRRSVRSANDEAARHTVEPLEARRLMSFGTLGGAPSLTPTDMQSSPGLLDPSNSTSIYCLTAQGTSGNDSIIIDDANGYLDVFVNGELQNWMPDWFATSVSVHAGAGDDSIVVTDAVTTPCWLYGEAGNDTLTGGASSDDNFYGGSGFDTVSYANRWSNLNLSLDGVANDGAAGEHDNIHFDVEVVIGGQGDDSITGSAGNDVLKGGGGNDTLDGGAGDDSLSGDWGNDLLLGNDGNDTMDGGAGSDTFFGGLGNDTVDYSNRVNPLTVSLDYVANDGETSEDDLVLPDVENVWGGHASDLIIGSGADNALYGGDGNDTLIGGDGNDTLDGGAGNDRLDGGAGDDDLRGGLNNDTLFAGAGSDVLSGGDGDDVLVSIGGGNDSLAGDAGFDSFWADSSDTFTQTDASEASAGHIHQVYGFADYHFGNGSTYSVSTELEGQNMPDPSGGFNYLNYANDPLFSSSGPSKNDIYQQGLGDCYFMATLSSIAKTNPDRIRQSVVDLGDGTYGVQFFNGNSPVYVRVDGDLPTDGMGSLVYANLGIGNSLWAALMEKAWAYHRHNDSNYPSIEGGDPSEAYGALGVSSPTSASTFGFQIMNRPDLLWSYVSNELAAGKSVVACTPDSPPNLAGDHCYEVDRVYVDGSGTRHIVLRNPWGPYVDVTDAQFMASVDEVDSAYV